MRTSAALLLFACGCGKTPAPPASTLDAGTVADTRIRVDGYRKDCTADSDCAEVYEGDTCAGCGPCRGVAIAAAALPEYRRDFDRLRAGCPPREGSAPMCKPCPPPQASCVRGTCVAGPAPDAGRP